MKSQRGYPVELRQRLIEEPEEHVIEKPERHVIEKPEVHFIDIKPEVKSGNKSLPNTFPNKHLQAYFISFLDFETLANYTFTDKATLWNVVSHACSPQVGSHKITMLKGLREIAYFEEDKALVDDCKVSMANETSETCVTKVKRHLTWFTPFFTSEAALLGGFIYKCVERSGVSDALLAATNKLLLATRSSCGGGFESGFFGYYEWDMHGDFNDPSSWHWRDTRLCVNDSPGWKDCSYMKVMTDYCHHCIDACGNINDLDSNYNSTWWQAFGWGVGTVAAAGAGVCAGIGVVCHWDKIQDLYNPTNKPFYRLSNQTKDQIYTLNIEFKMTDSAKTIIQKLDQKKISLSRPNRKAEICNQHLFAFTLFRETLPDKPKEFRFNAEPASSNKP